MKPDGAPLRFGVLGFELFDTKYMYTQKANCHNPGDSDEMSLRSHFDRALPFCRSIFGFIVRVHCQPHYLKAIIINTVTSQWVNHATLLGFSLVQILLLSALSLFPERVPGASLRPQDLPIKVDITLVSFSAVFVDSKGKRVTDIRGNEVAVTDNDEQEEISTFQAPSTSVIERVPKSGSDQLRSPLPEMRNAAPQMVLILLPGMRVENRHFAIRATAKYLQASHHDSVRVAVADTTGATLSFTSQKREMESFAQSLLKLPMPSAPWAESWRFRQAMVGFCASMSAMNGRKSILLFSDYYKPPNPYMHTTQPVDVYNLALQAGASVYPADSRGVAPVIPGGDASTSDGTSAAVNSALLQQSWNLQSEQSELAYIAANTGGRYVGGNDLSSAFDDMERDASASYELAYYKGALRHDGAFHRIKVIVKRPGLRVRTTGGYFAAAGDLSAFGADNELRFALNSERPFNDILLSFRPLFYPVTQTGGPAVVAVLGIRLDWGSPEDGSRVPGPTSVLGIVRGAGNRVDEFSSLGMPTELSEKGPLRASHWRAETWTGPSRITPGKDVIKVAARATSGDLGSAQLELSVPETRESDIRVSSLVLSRELKPIGDSHPSAALNDPLTLRNLRVMPAISNRFSVGQELFFFARIVGCGNQTPRATLSVSDMSGYPVLNPLSASLSDDGCSSRFGAPVLFSLPSDQFRHRTGSFLAKLAVTLPDGSAVGHTSVTFTVADGAW